MLQISPWGKFLYFDKKQFVSQQGLTFCCQLVSWYTFFNNLCFEVLLTVHSQTRFIDDCWTFVKRKPLKNYF